MAVQDADDIAHLEDVRRIATAFFEAWNRHDVSAMAALYSHDAQVVNSLGLWWRGVAEVEQGLGQMNAIGPSLRPESMFARFMSKDTAICIVDYTVGSFTRPGGQTVPEQKALSTFVMVNTERGWLMAAAQTTAVNADVIARLQSR
jgi:uncharacterized protein (TIGR02246 family)